MFRQPFIEGWDFVSILGEGTFGQVKLAMNNSNPEKLVAVKIIELSKVSDIHIIKKEICIHKTLNHSRIVKFYGYRSEPEEYYVFMEYVANGELYNMIEPGMAMNDRDTIKFFGQLLEGVEYMHSKGIVHRDLKLENLLIDKNDDLKITDFGLSTMFRHQGKERLLDRICGSLPYTAPEVLAGKKYNAEPADIWSCGIILYIMFQGEMPWDIANSTSPEFVRWCECKHPSSRWSKLHKHQLSLLQKILAVCPDSRITIGGIRQTKWFRKTCKLLQVYQAPSSQPINFVSHRLFDTQQLLLEPSTMHQFEHGSLNPNASRTDDAFFSQPLHSEYIMATQGPPGSSQELSPNVFSLFRRCLTRLIISNRDLPTVVNCLIKSLESSNCSWKLITQKCITVIVRDVRNQNLNFKVHLFCPPNGKILSDFRLYRGDGLEFKRIFKEIKNNMQVLIPDLI